MTSENEVVFLFDIDNTLLDNDRVESDIMSYIEDACGVKSRDRYHAIFEELRIKLGYSDYLGALQLYRLEEMRDPRLLLMSSFLLDYPFADRLYPGSLNALQAISDWGTTAILSDGDVVFQPRKIQRSGLWDAVGGRVMVYVHKERMLADVERRYPARHYVMVDDKLRVLTSMKEIWKNRLTTVFTRQGHYAHDPEMLAAYPPADITIEHISDLLNYKPITFLAHEKPVIQPDAEL
jgi:FMN phosphatase YigB (HAD superfamily)